ncbi:MAG: hypothetical protein QNJ98_01710 [Planctomycetota bacterium]|nr:hypothetical protein [Planctomycetota bacterium]
MVWGERFLWMLVGAGFMFLVFVALGTEEEPGTKPDDREPPPDAERLDREDLDLENPDSPGTPIRMRVDLRSRCPAHVEVGVPFEVEVVLTNVGNLALSGVTLAVRGDDSLEAPKDQRLELEFVRLKAGSSVTRHFWLVARRAGKARWYVSAREERGWAAGGLTVHVEAKDSASYKRTREEARAEPYALVVDATLLDDVEPDEPFRVRLRIENTGHGTLSDVRFAWNTSGGVRIAEGEPERMDHLDLQAGERKAVVVRFEAPSELTGKARVNASARDIRGWAASGVVLRLKGGVKLER